MHTQTIPWYKKPLTLLVFVIFLDMLGVGVLIPIIPALFTDPTSTFFILTPQQTPHALLLLGVMTALYPLMQFFAAPLLGDASDTYGRKPVLILSLLGTAFGYILFVIGIFLRSLPLLFVSRMIDGITGGNISVAQAAIADTSTPADRAKNFGMIGAAFGLGFILGPTLGGILGALHPAYPFVLTTLLSLSSVMVLSYFFQETHLEKKQKKQWSIFSGVTSLVRAFHHPKLKKLFMVVLFNAAGFTFFTSFFGAFLLARFGYTAQSIGIYFAYIGVWIVITQGFITRKVAGKYSDRILIFYPMIILSVMFLCFSLTKVAWALYVIAPIFAIANGLITANLSAKISRSAPPQEQGEIMGLNTAMNSFSQATVPLIAGVIASMFAVQVPLLFGAGMVLFAALMFWWNSTTEISS